MRRAVAVLAVVAVLFLLSASDVQGGAGGLLQPTKTAGPAISFTVVTVVAGSTKGQTALRVQKSQKFDGALFTSGYVSIFAHPCIQPNMSLEASTVDRFVGFMSWVPPEVRSQLLGTLGNPDKAAVTDINDVACSTINGVSSLSFTGTIQFEP